MTRAPLLAAEGLRIRSASETILEDVALTAGPAEVLAVTGGAATGKSLLLRALAGLPPAGVSVEGALRRPEGRVVLVPQGGPLAPHLTIGRQAGQALAAHGVDARTAQRRVIAALERLHVPAAVQRLGAYPHELGEAMRRRAALALALAAEPLVLLVDSLWDGLDPTVRARLQHRLADWARETGAALLLAGRPGDGVDGPADRSLVRGAAAPMARACDPVAGRAPEGPPALSVRDLRVAFPLGRTWRGETRWLNAVDGVGFELRAGEAVALLGESGSGKAVLARALARLIPAAGGRVAWLGSDLLALDGAAMRRARRDVQVLFPDPREAFDPAMTVGAQIAETLAALAPELDPAERVPGVLAEVGLPAELAGAWPAALSMEQAARAGLARALAPGARLIVADEPFAALDPGAREAFADLLLRIREERGVSLVVATDDAAAACRVAHRVLVLLNGRVVESGDAEALVRDARHPLTRAMLAAAEGRRPALEGDPPSPLRTPGGCPLRLRCPRARDYCAQEMPALEEVAPKEVAAGHRVACHYWDSDEGTGASPAANRK